MEAEPAAAPPYRYTLYKMKESTNSLMEKIAENVQEEHPDIKMYRESPYLRTNVRVTEVIVGTPYDPKRKIVDTFEFMLEKQIRNMKCGNLYGEFLIHSIIPAGDEDDGEVTYSLLEYKNTSEGEGLNTLLIFKINDDGMIEIVILCSEPRGEGESGGAGTLFNFFLYVVKKSMVELLGERYTENTPLIVVESLESAITFYEKYGFKQVVNKDGLTTLHRTVSGYDPTQEDDATTIQEMTLTKAAQWRADNVVPPREDKSAETSRQAKVVATKSTGTTLKRTETIRPHEGGPHKGGPHKGGTKYKSKTTRVLSKKKRRKTRRKRITHTNSGSSPHI
jgi:hypothetical protein